MKVLFDDQLDYMNEALLERVNPVFKTAMTTLFELAAADDADAITLTEKLQMSEEESFNSKRSKSTDENVLVNQILVETRFRSIGRLALQSGASLIVDLPCGFTPRGIQFAKENQQYLGLDLPATITRGESTFMSLIDEDKKHLIHYAACDATNYESLKKAIDDTGIDGEVCFCTEGLLMYFTTSETDVLCDNIHAILKQHGGCWLTADPEVSIQYALTIRSVFPALMEQIRNNSQKNVEDKAQIRMDPSDLIVMPAKDISPNMQKAMGFLARHGLKAERVVISEIMGDLKSLEKLDKEKAEQYKAAMNNAAFWKITLAEQATGEEIKTEGTDFAVTMQWEGKTLNIKLDGRVDTLSAPSILSLFEEEKVKSEIDRVILDCSDLEYISSAGLRVLLIIHKSAADGLNIRNTQPLVDEILEQTGFVDIFEIN